MHSHIVVGLAFGDEGKGSWVDHLCRRHKIRTVVRFNGGAQALHHVTTSEGVTHGFSQFGSHSFIPGAKTVLSRYMLIEPTTMLAEAQELQKKGVRAPLRSLIVSKEAPLISESNVLLNRAMEAARGSGRHGSCGLGIGLTQGDVEELGDEALYIGDVHITEQALSDKVHFIHERALARVEMWENEASASYVQQLREFDIPAYVTFLRNLRWAMEIVPEGAIRSTLRRNPVVFEGAQGVLLDQFDGFFPHCTRSTTTTQNAKTLLTESGFTGDVTSHGLLRAYGTRHGAGPFVTEASVDVLPCDNSTGEWQGVFRHGWFDAVATRYALECSLVDNLVVTNLDRLDGLGSLKVAVAYREMKNEYYNAKARSIRRVGSYPESEKRTQALASAKPVYETHHGWEDGSSLTHEAYLQFLESELKQSVAAISRRKDDYKVYRV